MKYYTFIKDIQAYTDYKTKELKLFLKIISET